MGLLFTFGTILVVCLLKNHDGVLANPDNDVKHQHQSSWSALLEEWVNSPTSERDGRVLQTPNKYIPVNNMYIKRRIGSGAPPNKDGFNFNGNVLHRITQTTGYEVSETDLYLLSAIEKLVYRVDYMEKRLRKTEQIIYYLMEGNQNNRESLEKPCPFNFTKIGDSCYLIEVRQVVNWKTANNICKSYGSKLAEFDSTTEQNLIATYLLHNKNAYGNSNFWLGGLNPGLLWIWSSSGQPVIPNFNISSIQNNLSAFTNNSTLPTTTVKPDQGGFANSTQPPKVDKKPNDPQIDIQGNGRCLSLSNKQPDYSYKFYGSDCAINQPFLCKLTQDYINNEISRIAKSLGIFNSEE